MFGLMRAKRCGMTPEEKTFRRLHYCGTCKTIGSVFGQKSRLLLNNDIVFLAELLTSLSGNKIESWQRSYQSYNCLSLPQNDLPISLRFAAAANVILAEFKIRDHLSDTRQKRFEFAHRVFSREFILAETLLNSWDFPLEELRNILNTQKIREDENLGLSELSFPTASATGNFFSHGMRLIERNDLAETARELGFAFGKLIYILDAFDDFERDAESNQFNALRSGFGGNYKYKAISILLDLENEIITKIHELPLSESLKEMFSLRLRNNLQAKLKDNLPQHARQPKQRFTLSNRFKLAKRRAKELTVNHSWASILPIFAFVLAFAFISPVHAREAKSARECAELSFNLMFIGSILGTVVAFPSVLMQQQGGTPPPLPSEKKKGRRRTSKGVESNGGWCCFCGDCDCIECGCDSCDCCDCCSDCGCDC